MQRRPPKKGSKSSMATMRKKGYMPFAKNREELLKDACIDRHQTAPRRRWRNLEAINMSGAWGTDFWRESRYYRYAFVRAKKKFLRLRDEWKSQRGHESSTMKLVLFPAYQHIIGMGPAAVPFLLRELETNIDMWFWALMA